MADILTDKQRLFADQYLLDFNGSRAYKAIYNCSDETARTNASRLLAKANIQDYLTQRMADREKRTEISQDKVLMELADIAFDRLGQRAGDRLKGLELLGKHLGMFTDKVQLESEKGIEIRMIGWEDMSK